MQMLFSTSLLGLLTTSHHSVLRASTFFSLDVPYVRVQRTMERVFLDLVSLEASGLLLFLQLLLPLLTGN